jgi:hypothetical protein
MTSQDNAEFADLDRYITWQLGQAAAQLDSRIDTRGRLQEALRLIGIDRNCEDGVDVIPRN